MGRMAEIAKDRSRVRVRDLRVGGYGVSNLVTRGMLGNLLLAYAKSFKPGT
jgi:hypothetical protein